MCPLQALTSKLVERGCPDHPRLRYISISMFLGGWALADANGKHGSSAPGYLDEKDVYHLWAGHAIDWWRDQRKEGDKREVTVGALCSCWENHVCLSTEVGPIEAIEVATRPKAGQTPETRG
jgi:hypothetical protein